MALKPVYAVVAVAFWLSEVSTSFAAPKILEAPGTLPFKLPDRDNHRNMFRLALKVKSATEAEHLITAIRYSPRTNGLFGNPYELFGWSAASLGGTTCVVPEGNVKGIGVFGRYADAKDAVPELPMYYKETLWVASPTRATFIVADFECDAPPKVGEQFDIQVRIYAKSGQRWHPVDLTYEGKAVGPAKDD